MYREMGAQEVQVSISFAQRRDIALKTTLFHHERCRDPSTLNSAIQTFLQSYVSLDEFEVPRMAYWRDLKIDQPRVEC
jgi:hypothetical protein